MKIILGFAVALLTFVPSASAQGKSAPVLDKLIAGFVTTFNAKDMTALASYYAEDATWLPPNSPLITGRPAIEAAFKQRFNVPATLKLAPMESGIAGSFGFSVGTYTVTVTMNGGSQTFAAKYMTLFKRVGNDWKIAYDMQNADQTPVSP